MSDIKYNYLFVSDFHIAMGVRKVGGNYTPRKDFFYDAVFNRFLKWADKVEKFWGNEDNSGGGGGVYSDIEESESNYPGYNDWEADILETLSSEGGEEGAQAVEYIVENDIHIKVGKPFVRFKGDWESKFNVGAWFKGDDYVVLNPNSGYSEDTRPSLWGLSLVAHEAKHIEQGWGARTKGGEMEAWQLGIRILLNLGGEIKGNRDKYVSEAQTVGEFVEAIKKYDPVYWRGLKFYPPWISPYDRFI
jgi:hypothetical protein